MLRIDVFEEWRSNPPMNKRWAAVTQSDVRTIELVNTSLFGNTTGLTLDIAENITVRSFETF